MNWLKQNLITLILLVIPFLILPFIWDKIPAEIPIHWNIKGEADGYGSRSTHLLIPFINIGIAVLFWAIPYLDPKRNTALFKGTIQRFLQATIGFLVALWGALTALYLGYPVDIETFIPVGVLLLMLFMGNYMGKVRPGYFVGVRTPWTLESEEVWVKTHRLTGRIWVFGALLTLLLRFIVPGSIYFWFFLAFALAASLIPIIYSYVLYQKLPHVKQ